MPFLLGGALPELVEYTETDDWDITTYANGRSGQIVLSIPDTQAHLLEHKLYAQLQLSGQLKDNNTFSGVFTIMYNPYGIITEEEQIVYLNSGNAVLQSYGTASIPVTYCFTNFVIFNSSMHTIQFIMMYDAEILSFISGVTIADNNIICYIEK